MKGDSPSLHPVIQVLKERLKSGSTPLSRSDGNKVGLAIEGGGMRGVISAGMVTAIQSLRLLDAFDVICGTSAGAFNGAYLLARQAPFGTTIYYDEIANRDFIDPRRFLFRGPVMSMSFLVDVVAVERKRLDCRAILQSPIKLRIVATKVNSCQKAVLGNFQQEQQVLEALRATATMPIIAGPPVAVEGELYYDGGVVEQVPFPTAIAEDCTHVLVLLTRPRGKGPEGLRWHHDWFARRYLRDYPGVLEKIRERPEAYREEIKLLRDHTESGDGPPYIYAVQPSKNETIPSRLDRCRPRLVDGARNGFRALYEVITGGRPTVHELLFATDDLGRPLDHVL